MLNVLICCFEKGIQQLAKNLPDPLPSVSYYISWQGQDLTLLDLPKSLTQRDDVQVGILPGRGLSRNRNNCIKLAKVHQASGLFLLADDDVVFLPGFEQKIASAFTEFTKAAILCFKVLSQEGDKPFKTYSERSSKINLSKIDRVSSIEIAGRMEVFNEISFDERLGLGAQFPSGEETAFLADSLRQGFSIRFVPEFIVSHPFETSGKKRTDQFSDIALQLIGGRAYRIYGPWLAYFFFLFSSVKNYPKYRHQQSFFAFLKALFEGSLAFKKS